MKLELKIEADSPEELQQALSKLGSITMRKVDPVEDHVGRLNVSELLKTLVTPSK